DTLDRPEIMRDQDLVFGRHRPGLLLVLADLQPAFAAVEGEMIALDRHEAVQRIGHLYAALVADRSGHRIEDVDLLAQDASVAEITALRGGPLVEHFEPGIARQVHVELADALVVAGPAACAAERPGPAVMDEGTAREDLARIGGEIPVEEVEMVGGLVHEQAA